MLGNEFTVDENVDHRKHFFCYLAEGAAVRGGQKILVQSITCIAPDIFLRIELTDPSKQRNKLPLILWLHRFSAQTRDPGYMRGRKLGKQLLFRFLRVGNTVCEAPRFGIEAVLTVMCTSRNKEGNADSLAVCDIT